MEQNKIENTKMHVIVPAAGLSRRFPNMKPKYLLYDYKGELMIKSAISQFLNKFPITIGILKEHDEKFSAGSFLKYELQDSVNIVILENLTSGPADTVYQILNKAEITDSQIFIKDCDSFFEHEISDDNYVCVSKISEHEVLKKLSSKSFVRSNDQNIITDIIEKQVVSDTFCVGGYKFESSEIYKKAYESLNKNREVFVSDVIGKCISDKHIFTIKTIKKYTDVGTSDDWFAYNDKPVIFCDIDGTLIQNQNRVGNNNYNDDIISLQSNIDVLLEYQKKGSQFVFTTSRPKQYEARTREVLDQLGFNNYTLIIGLLNTRRILINDYNESNPHPRATAINIRRNANNLKDFL